jgi:hypothetical protein
MLSPQTGISPRTRNLCLLLFLTGLGGALLSSFLLAGVTLLLAIAGVGISARKLLVNQGWSKPKELRLIHFAFWFFVLVSLCSWMIEGFNNDGGKTLITHAGLILFWPLIVVLSYANIRASTLFTGTALICLSVAVVFLTSLSEHNWALTPTPQPPVGGGIDVLSLALLSGVMTLAGGMLFVHQKKRLSAVLLLLAGSVAVVAAILMDTRSNLITLPFLLLALLPLPGKKLRITGAAFSLIVLAIAIVAHGQPFASLNELALSYTHSLPDTLSKAFIIFIPFSIFARYLFSKHPPAAHLASAGVIITTGYFIFGLTDAPFNRPLFLAFYLFAIAGLASTLFNELTASYVRNRTRKVSATVITKNEEHHIADCLQSARLVADEIIVLDSGSTDRTVDIARQYADVVEITDWPGFGIQKQRALEKATGDWVLSLDADERITPELAREINHRLADPDADAYKLPWAVTLYGTRLDFGRSGRAPLRLFRRDGVTFSDALVHEKIRLPGGRKVRTLRGRLTHFTHRDFGHALDKSAKYAWLGSREKFRRGKRTRTLVYPTLRGLMTFVQVYFIRFGFLDGSVGFLVAMTYAQGSFNKYAGLWTLTRTEKQQSGTPAE